MCFGPKSLRKQAAVPLTPTSDKQCAICERCRNDEAAIVASLTSTASAAAADRAARGSIVTAEDMSIFSDFHSNLATRPSISDSLPPERAFALLSVSGTDSRSSSNASRTFLVLRSLHSKLEYQIENSSISYVSPKELERLLFGSGFDWLSREDVVRLHTDFDLNNSGSLHVMELLAVVMKAMEHARTLTRAQVTTKTRV